MYTLIDVHIHNHTIVTPLLVYPIASSNSLFEEASADLDF